MPCQGCKDPEKPHVKDQHAVRFKAWYTNDQTFQGCCEAWNDLPDDGVLLVLAYFSDDTSRICDGADWYGLYKTPDGFWTIIHNNDDLETNKKRYPEVAWKRGVWTSEANLKSVLQQALS